MNTTVIRHALVFALCAPLAGWAHHAPGHEDAPVTPSKSAAPASGSQTMQQAPRAKSWTQQPLILPAERSRGERASAQLKLEGITAGTLTVFAPEGPPERRRVDYPVQEGAAKIEAATPKIGNYHWVIAREETPEVVRVASTAWYFGNPGASPKTLLLEPKHELEIIPQPLPREHASYREAERWRFLVRFKGAPLANQPVTLETAFGSKTTAFTDTSGFATILLPRDFKPAAQADGHADHGPQRAPFVLSTVWQAEGRRYETAFNHFYTADPERNRSLGWGALFGLVGMLAATPLLKRRNLQGDHGHV